MIMNSRSGKDLLAKQEGDHQDANNYKKISKIIPSSSSSRQQWSSTLKNPRIVRVSRNFGGKDRHSKVCTIRGLRDRRIRLAVPTAIQLYELQDRLGLSQPSKVVDWLLDAAKYEIDKLPPLPIPVGMNFGQFVPQESSANQTHNYQAILSRKEELGIKNQENHQQGLGFGGYVAQNFFPMGNNCQSPFPINYNWDHSSNLSLSQFGTHSFANQIEESSSAPPPSSSSQLYFYPSATAMPPFNFPPLIPSVMGMNSSMENDLRQINHLQQVHQQNPILPTTRHLISSNAKNQKNIRSMEHRNEERRDS